MMDRKIAPEFKQIGKTSLFQPEKKEFKNGIPFFVFNLHEAELIKLEWAFKIKNWDLNHPLNGVAAAKLMDDGTHKKTSAQIIEEIDFYGSYFQVHVHADMISLELYSLRKYLSKTLPVIYEILNEAIFPDTEIEVFKTNNIQRIQVDDQKVQKLGSKLFYKSIFGAESRYGYGEKVQDFRDLNRLGIEKAYEDIFHSNNCTLFASGKVEDSEIDLIETYFGREAWGKKPNANTLNVYPDFIPVSAHYHFEPIESANQSAVKIGKPLVLKSHPDYPALQVLNTVLGGYFGSRLMSNIREDKGYTYGIGSAVNALQNQGFFYISTEVNAEATQATLHEIQKEIERLQTEMIPTEELDLVKNFIRGSFMASLENAFSYADKFKGIYYHNLDYSYYDRLFDTLDSVNAQTLKNLANQYWDWNSFHQVIVGKE